MYMKMIFKAKQFLAAKVAGKRVRIVPETTARYGRTVDMVLLNGVNINEQIIANGYGWVYRKYCTASHCDGWLKKEAPARKARLGLWQDKNPQSPWDWRAEKKNTGSGVYSTKSWPVIVGTAAVGRAGSAAYHGNQSSKVFHGPSCQHYNCENCVVKFRSIEEAKRAGLRAHRECAVGSEALRKSLTVRYVHNRGLPKTNLARLRWNSYAGSSKLEQARPESQFFGLA
jgi:micrococcal nuclease